MNRCVVNESSIAAHFRGPDGQRVLDVTTDGLEGKAKRFSPDKTGYFKARFRIAKYPTFRRLYNIDWFGHLVEFGSKNNPAYAPLRKAARALGLKFRKVDRGR